MLAIVLGLICFVSGGEFGRTFNSSSDLQVLGSSGEEEEQGMQQIATP